MIQGLAASFSPTLLPVPQNIAAASSGNGGVVALGNMVGGGPAAAAAASQVAASYNGGRGYQDGGNGGRTQQQPSASTPANGTEQSVALGAGIKVAVPLGAPAEFNLVERLRGPDNSYIRHIETNGGCEVKLRGMIVFHTDISL